MKYINTLNKNRITPGCLVKPIIIYSDLVLEMWIIFNDNKGKNTKLYKNRYLIRGLNKTP